ncbi:AAA family ATPase [Cystobacter fuscus]|uniref:AAA family ATPase n=1 Tax=Cystobacter fuscus TaxID=43 RepID=UPI002B31DA22|nr:AAA domain-containing protein [Cystobacter fuscus]
MMDNYKMQYKKIFDPEKPYEPVSTLEMRNHSVDRRDGILYEYTESIVLAVNVALATGRPLLLRGPSGSGKSSLAPWVARIMGWRYYEDVISSRTQAKDLLWHFDSLRRLNDAQAMHQLQNDIHYIEPSVLWWAFDRESAERRGAGKGIDVTPVQEPNREINELRRRLGVDDRAVVLLDEIDKAEPDVPNDLLVPLGSLQFSAGKAGMIQAKQPPFVVMTSNDERELPVAFLRRCVVLELPTPSSQRLIRIATIHFGAEHKRLYEQLATKIDQLRDAAIAQGRRPPSAPEFLDAVRACLQLRSDAAQPDDQFWEQILQVTLIKRSW